MFQARRFLKTLTSELRKGDWLKYESQYVVVHSVTSAHSGRGARTFNVMLRPVQAADSLISLKPTAAEAFEKLELKDKPYSFLYDGGDSLHFSHPETFEEVEVPRSKISPTVVPFLETGTKVRIKFNEDDIVTVQLANKSAVLCIKEILSVGEGAGKGRTALALLENGMQVSCPGFVKVGDKISVDVDDGTYSGRA